MNVVRFGEESTRPRIGLDTHGSDWIQPPSGSYPMAILQFWLETSERLEITGLDRLPHFHIRFSRLTEGRSGFLCWLSFPVEDPTAIGAEVEVI